MSHRQEHTCYDSKYLANIFHFLAGSMDYPDAKWLVAEHGDYLHQLVAELGWQEAISILPSGEDLAKDLTALQVEYTRLFINAIPHVIAPLYGSVYVDSEEILYGPSSEKAKRFYLEQGFDLVGENDIPDYLGHELRFCALLLEEGKGAEAEAFLHQCFSPWFELFCSRVCQESRHPYYRVVVQLIHFFTKEEESYVR